MLRNDFVTLIGSQPGKADYIPVACLLRNGYGVAGYFNTPVNEGLVDTCVLVNARLLDLTSASESRRGLPNFTDFVEEIVTRMMENDDFTTNGEFEGSSYIGGAVPLTAIPLGISRSFTRCHGFDICCSGCRKIRRRRRRFWISRTRASS